MTTGVHETRSKLDKKNVEDILSLSPVQEGILYYYLQDQTTKGLYIEQIRCTLEGYLDKKNFEQAWKWVVDSNEILRSVFRWKRLDKPIQVVLNHGVHTIRYFDLSHKDAEIRFAEHDRLAVREREGSFDLETETLRLAILKMDTNRFELILSFHHIILDGWSTAILFKELFASYHDLKMNRQPVPLKKAKYKEFIKYHMTLPKQSHHEFWKTYLKGYTAANMLPYDEPHEGGKSPISRHQWMLANEKSEYIREYVRKLRLTPATFFYGIWAFLLGKYGNSKDVMFGTTTSGRRNANIEHGENTMGLFINTIPLRVQFGKETEVQQFFLKLHDELTLRQNYEDTPLYEIKSMSELDKQSELLKSVVVLENYPLSTNETSDSTALTLESYSSFSMTNYDLVLMVVPSKDQFQMIFDYQSNQFSRKLIERLAHHVDYVIAQIIQNPKLCLKDIELITDSEKQTILGEFNDTFRAMPMERTFDQLFEGQARRTPEKIAVEYGNQVLTYAELNQKANLISYVLKEKGIQSDTPVVLIGDRSIEMLTSMMGIFKAGGAYIPVNPKYPVSRIHQMVANSEANVMVITTPFNELNSNFVEDICRDTQLRHVICMFEPRTSLNALQFNSQHIEVTNMLSLEQSLEVHSSGNRSPRDLSYIIYTSGSTGKPKGAMVEHVGMINHLYAKINDLGLTEDDYVVQNAPHCFDVSVWQFLAPLLVGGRTIIVPEELILDPERFLSYVIEKQASILEVVPSYLDVLLGELESNPHELPNLRHLLVTGEPVKPKTIEKWFDIYPHNKSIVNAYGPTEASDDITHYFMSEPVLGQVVPIGQPIQNMRIYIVDDDMKLCPIGVKGEICVAGIGVGRGYYNDSERTNVAFLKDPFMSGDACRMYRTGDLGCWKEDGSLLFYGRKDYQVKISGHRIELGEIEHALDSHPEMKESAVIVDENSSSTQLWAFLVGHKQIEAAELKQYLKSMLPNYMVPAGFFYVDQMPLTNNGKLDRHELKCMLKQQQENIPHVTLLDVARWTDVEKKILSIWKSVLEKKTIGLDDHFFDLGGNSILLMRMHAQIEKQYPGRISVTDLFNFSTIRALADKLQQPNCEQGPLFVDDPILPNDIKLPIHFFNPNRVESRKLLQIEIEGALWNKIQAYAIGQKVSSEVILTTALMYLFSKVSGQQIIEIYTSFGDRSRLSRVAIDFERVETLSDIIVKYPNNETAVLAPLLPVDTHYVRIMATDARGDSPYASSMDINVEIEGGAHSATITWEFNERKLNNDAMTALFQQYASLVQTLFED